MNVRRASPNGKRRTTVLAVPGGGRGHFARLAGSRSTVAVEVVSEQGEGSATSLWGFQDVFAGPPTGDLAPLGDRCALNGEAQIPQALDVSGPYVAHVGCDGEYSGVVSDTRSGDTTVTPAWRSGLRIAGRYLAWVRCCTDYSIDVYDWKAGELVYTIPGSQLGDVVDLDVAADGTVVVPVRVGDLTGRLAWATPASPQLHAIPIPKSETYFVRLVGNRIAFERGVSDRGEVPRAEVGVTDLQGHSRTLARGAYGSSFERQLDFDGERVAWYAFSCRGARMHVQSIYARLVTESLTRCPLRLLKKPRFRDDGRLSLRFDCHGYSGGNGDARICFARNIVLTASSGGKRVVVARGSRAKRLPVTDAGRQLLKERGTLKVRIEATMRDPAGTRERRKGKTTLVAP